MSTGACLMVLWIICLYGIVVGVWWIRLRDYFRERNAAAGIRKGADRLAAVALTGHVCDITMGMVLLPVSRHSALASFFQIPVSTTLTYHILTAYTLFILVIIHGILYVSWLPVFNNLSASLRMVIPVLNPTYLYTETWPGDSSSIGIWRASLVFTGSMAAAIMAALFMTTLPRVRTRDFNLFYFTHLLSILMVAIVCLHASTMFYCTAPGLAMWVLDWGMRFHELRRTLDGTLSTLGNGWYWSSVTIPLPRARLTGCSCRSPLAHFYIHHARSSIRELHPFTTITHLASKNDATPPSDEDIAIQFLFRKQGKPMSTHELEEAVAPKPFYRRMIRGKKERAKSVQWTAKLASLVDEKSPGLQHAPLKGGISDLMAGCPPTDHGIGVSLRLEGPYFSPADPHRYDTVICMVAGTGISGALAIAAAFSHAIRREQDARIDERPAVSRRWRRCIIVWSVKASSDIDLMPLDPISEGLELRKFLTGNGRRRLDLEQELADLVEGRDRTWIYISGPNAFIIAVKDACKHVKKKADVDFYAANWDI
ncbi:MAG: hypothetical protein Q9217_005553 [Psora testacea]